MALPRIETPTYSLELPSTGEKIKFRPFLVKEQKILLMAQESKNDEEIVEGVGKLVRSCTFDKIDIETVPMFDIEYLFLQIRAKSAGETATLKVTCPDDKKTSVEIKVNLEEIKPQMNVAHNNEVIITDTIKLYLKYPVLSDMKGVLADGDDDIARVFTILNKCISSIHYGEEVYNRVDMTEEDINGFIDELPTKKFDEVMEFFDTMPKLRHVVSVTNPNTKVKSDVTIEGLQNFLV